MLRLYRARSGDWAVDTGESTEVREFKYVSIQSAGVTVTVTLPECALTPDSLTGWVQFDAALLIFAAGDYTHATIVARPIVYLDPNQSPLSFE